MIDRKQKVVLGGLPQKIHIRGNKESNPFLLFLHGGPGVCNRHSVMTANPDLFDVFNVVAWDQRGSGGSYKGASAETLTVSRIVDDAKELIEWICKEYSRDKVFIIGGSWGSALGTVLAARYPEHIAAFVGFGQFVSGSRNEEISYNFAMNEAVKAGDGASIEKLKKIGAPQGGLYKDGFDGMMAQRRVMMKFGGYSKNEKKRSYWSSMVVPMLTAGEYSVSDIFGIIKGYKFVLETMWSEVVTLEFPRDYTAFSVPYFIFDGRLDQNTPAELVEEFFELIKAPHKELIWFEQSGHNPLGDEPERFKELLKDRLIKIAETEKGL